MRISILLFFIFIFSVTCAFGQKKVMTPEVYKSWNAVRSVQISDNGNWTKYHLQPQEGNRTLKIHNNRDGKTYTFDRVLNSKIDQSGTYAVFRIGLDYHEKRALKRKKTEPEDMPKDTLCIYNLLDKHMVKISNVKSFSVPDKWSDYIAYLKGPEESTDTLNTLPKETKKSGTKLILVNLQTQDTDTLFYAKEYRFAEEGQGIAAVSKGVDSLMNPGVYTFDFDNSNWSNVLNTKGDISNISWYKDGSQLSFIADRDTTEERVRPYELFSWKASTSEAQLMASDASSFLPEGYNISSFTRPSYSDNGKRLFFAMTPPPVLQDTSILDDEIVNVEVWNYQDDRLYTRQENNLDDEREKDFGVMHDLVSNRTEVIQKEKYDRILYDENRESRYAIGVTTEKYQKYMMWKGHGYYDAVLVDLERNTEKNIVTKARGRMYMSPNGKYAISYDSGQKIHFAYNLFTGNMNKITTESIGMFADEQNDRPMDPWQYGEAGFTNNEDYILIYDRYDIWQVDPDNKEKPKRLTKGREQKRVYRIVDLDREESIVDITNPLMLHRFDENDKSEAYVSFDCNSSKESVLYNANERLDRSPYKARLSDDIVTTREDYQRFPDLVHTDVSMNNMKTISNANPQQSEYNWGEIELVSWKSLDGVDLRGLLVLPDNFNPDKKYPLIVNFYERSSDGLNRHRAPFAHRSTINYSYYSSKGYILFNPDIVYRNGYPGQSCYDAVMPGVQSIVDRGYIDEDKIGVQGHSWGGYQIADLLTKTDIFKCAESGAPVVNMVSAYGGIRWGSGMSRMFQYEKTQSRLGATLWEKPELYLENSPIFNLDKVTTPVLILHNDEDGAVPWYQGIEYFNGLRRLQKPAWLLNYNGEPHWPVKWQNKLDFNIRMEQFFDHYLMDAPAPRWLKRGVPAIEKGIHQGLELDKN